MLFEFGNFAVQFFFVLSGFIVYYNHKNDIGVSKKISIFIKKRFMRIYPVYWLAVLVHSFKLFMFDNYNSLKIEFLPLISGLLLIGGEPPITIAWTLVHEIIFYLFFGLLILSKKVGSIVFIIWQVIILTLNIPSQDIYNEFGFLFSCNNLLFGFGMIACFLALKFEGLIKKRGIWFFLTGNLIFLSALLGFLKEFLPFFHSRVLLAGFASFLIVLGSMDNMVESLFKKNQFILFLGTASYSIYLIHGVGIPFTGAFIDYLKIINSNTLIYFIMTTMAVLAGVLFYCFIEAPVYSWLKKKTM